MMRTQLTPVSELRPGDRIRHLGRIREITDIDYKTWDVGVRDTDGRVAYTIYALAADHEFRKVLQEVPDA
jgi:hypothetical protein